jgi:sulfur carrier protein
MKVVVNGSERTVADGTTVDELVRICGPAGVGDRVAVARNAEVVPRSAWRDTRLADGDRIELLAAVQGGS